MIRRLKRSESGTSFIEFAIVAPFLIFLVIGLIELGRYTYFSILAAHAARAAVAFGGQNLSTALDAGGMTQAATTDAASLPNWTGNIAPNYLCSVNGGALGRCPASPGAVAPINTVYYVQVTVTGEYNTLLNYPGIPNNVWVSGSATMRVGGQ
ncbi:MAG: TadE/TadG family type IV pilus assembly protein [Candidatus Cybelea sp.]